MKNFIKKDAIEYTRQFKDDKSEYSRLITLGSSIGAHKNALRRIQDELGEIMTALDTDIDRCRKALLKLFERDMCNDYRKAYDCLTEALGADDGFEIYTEMKGFYDSTPQLYRSTGVRIEEIQDEIRKATRQLQEARETIDYFVHFMDNNW